MCKYVNIRMCEHECTRLCSGAVRGNHPDTLVPLEHMGTRRHQAEAWGLLQTQPQAPALPALGGARGPRVVGQRLLTSYHTEAKEVGFSDAGQVAHLLEELVPGGLHLR